MNNNIQHIIALIDRSGSMAGKEKDTIMGINTMLNQLKNDIKDGEEIFVTIKLFDDELLTLIENIKINDVELLKCSDFITRGQTALLDSLGQTLQEVISKKRRNILFYNSCLIYVCTDGLENASKTFSKNDVKKLIQKGKDEEIEVLYLGANQDSFLEAQTLGINLNGVMNYDENPDTIRNAYSSVAKVASRVRSENSEVSFTYAERQSSQVQNELLNNVYSPSELSRENDIQLTIPPVPLLRRQTNIELLEDPPCLKRTKSHA